jgi:hypothetical protein
VFLFLGYRGSADKRMPWGCRPAGLSTPPSFLVPAFARTPFLPSLYAILSLCLFLFVFLSDSCPSFAAAKLVWFGCVCLFVCLVVFFFSFNFFYFTCGLLFCVSIFEVVEAFLLLLLLISGFSSGSSRYVRCDFGQEEGRKLCMLEYYACRGGRREENISAV